MPPDTGAASLAGRLLAGERGALAEALNQLDDQRPAAVEQSGALLRALLAAGVLSRGHLIGITGPPGVGKSTLSSALIATWRRRGLRVGVLAVDPASPVTGGALLGDRLRMQVEPDDDDVFIRSLSSRGEFGGLSAQVWPMSLAMLAANDVVLIETVGVGQREIDIANSADTTCYVAQPGSGDSIQFLKAGILEVPHVLVVNKSDMGETARRAHSELLGALAGEHAEGGWDIPVLLASASRAEGIEALADAFAAHRERIAPELVSRRRQHQAHWIEKRLLANFGQQGLKTLGGSEALRERLATAD
ncbi:MAG: methylmalonyl Co-A mutase-associated GTPase MeaB [Halioglobus sp.]|nr:methylmalonyl Co-A mutase-associated GTPase MeaB [Halioglobus sp.]